MKFGDKLIILRKKNGLSQEELAEKLGVSRQSVSKWESNNTYPETDKIVQICNLFDCSMDDLINDKITDVEGALRKNKNNLNEVWDSLLDFITKTINMFSHMKFSTGLKCVIEMAIIAFLLWLVGLGVCGITSSVIANLFGFLGNGVSNTIENVLRSIFNILWFVIAIIALVHTFKIRYLNYYEETDKENEEKSNKKESNSKTEIKTAERVVIRDEKDKPFAFLSVLSKIVLFFIKFIVFWIAFGTIFALIGLVIASVVSIAFIPTNMIFVGSTLSLVSGSVIAVLFLLLCIYFIISKKVNIKVFVIIFIAALVTFGVGIGICALSAKNLDIITREDNKNLTTEELTIQSKPDLVVTSYDIDNYIYVIDETVPADTIQIEVTYDHDIKNLKNSENEEDKLTVYKLFGEYKSNYKETYKIFVEDLKKNQINVDHLDSGINSLTIKANSQTINTLIANFEKLYLLEKHTEGNVTRVIRHRAKVSIINGRGHVEYDARSDELIYKESKPKDFSCSRSIEKDTWGEVIMYQCGSPNDYIYDEYYEDYEEDYDE